MFFPQDEPALQWPVGCVFGVQSPPQESMPLIMHFQGNHLKPKSFALFIPLKAFHTNWEQVGNAQAVGFAATWTLPVCPRPTVSPLSALPVYTGIPQGKDGAFSDSIFASTSPRPPRLLGVNRCLASLSASWKLLRGRDQVRWLPVPRGQREGSAVKALCIWCIVNSLPGPNNTRNARLHFLGRVLPALVGRQLAHSPSFSLARAIMNCSLYKNGYTVLIDRELQSSCRWLRGLSYGL